MPRQPLPAGESSPLDESTIFRSLHAAYPDALLVVDAAGAIVLANPAASDLLGYSMDELVGMGVEMLVPDAVRARHAGYRSGYARRPVQRPMGTDMSLVARRKDGSDVMVEIALSPLQDHGLPYTVAAIRGIGEYPRVKQALQRARYSEMLAQLGRVAVDTRDPDVLLAQVPQVAVEALHVDFAAVLLLEPDGLAFRVASGVNLVDGQRVGDLEANRRDTLPGQVLLQGRPVVAGDDARTTPVARPYAEAGLVHGVGVPLSDRGRIIGVLKVRSKRPQAFDGEELRFLESLSSLLATTLQRTRSEEALNHAARLESVGQLTGGIAHDFNNLLTVIQGNLQVLEALPSIERDQAAQPLLAAAARAARRGAELTRKLLAFSRRQVLQPTSIDVRALLESLADMLRRTVDQRIRIDVDAAAVPPCRADPGQLESALLNIAINARDAMPEGGELRFRAAAVQDLPEAAQGDRRDASPTGYVAISIADTGGGMSEDVRERAFEPFFTTKPAGRGTGLGLSTVYGFVRQSHGGVAIESALGAGTTVTLYIPAARASGESEASDAAPAALPAGLRVLLVEDDPEVRQVAVRFLQSFGCRLTECSTAEDARARLEAGEVYEVLVSDIALGTGMRGTELAAWASARVPSLGVLLVSGFSRELVDADRDSPPDWELLGKPYSREELAAALARAVRR